jgi:hypothetical protein
LPSILPGRSNRSEMRESLHCTTDDETVRRFGRDDAVLEGGDYA